MTAADRAEPAYTVLAGRLRHRFLGGDLTPGSRLPSEPVLCTEFAVGRSTLREALRVLASQDLIQTTRGVGGGGFVAVPTVGHISAHLETGVSLLAAARQVTVEQVLATRHALEVPAAAAAARERTPAHLDELRRAESDPTDVIGPQVFTANQEFHLVLLRASGNPLLEAVTAPLFRVLSTRFGRDHAPDGFWTCVADDHAEILDLVTAQDTDGAAEAMQRHPDHLAGAYREMDRHTAR